MIVTVDFETEAIVGNPLVTPPSCLYTNEWPSAGVAVWIPGEEPTYELIDEDVVSKLRRLWYNPEVELLFHNAPFDLSVAQRWLGFEWPTWDRIHDTMYLVFHYNPYGDLALKPASEAILGLEPEEQNELHDWIVRNVPGATKKTAGAYISKAPLELVAKYAIGDVVRTRQLYDFIMEQNIYETSR